MIKQRTKEQELYIRCKVIDENTSNHVNTQIDISKVLYDLFI